jgi:hypothetical protein
MLAIGQIVLGLLMFAVKVLLNKIVKMVIVGNLS